MRLTGSKAIIILPAIALAAWVFWLRWPTFGHVIWNLDEGIHATVARTIVDGGVMYRDAVDQRTPLTYYIVAAVFGVFGSNNVWAVHALLAAVVATTAIGLFLLGRRWQGSAAGIWAALVFCALSTNLLHQADSNSISTEWFVSLFTTLSAWWFWRTWEQRSFGQAALAGAGFAAAFLSKQPGLLELGVPLVFVLHAACTRRIRPAEAARMIAGLCAGFTALTALVFGYFLAQGALDEMYFYAWTYNLVYYGPETTLPDRLNSAAAFGQLLWQQYAVIAVILVLGLGSRLLLLAQQRPTEQESTARPAALYNLVWLVLSLAAAASAGRVYGHYYLQLLPSVSLLAGLQLAEWQQALAGGRLLPKLVRVGLLLAAAWSVTVGAARGFWPAEPYLDSGLAPARVVSQVTERHERIFVWGYSPDFYLFADRRPASRFIYCSFQTGLVPWTNTAPGLDTRYASVSGTMATLLSDLTRELPACFIDTSLSAYRKFDKYPIDEFHALRDLVQQNYVVIQPTAFEPHGFRLHLLKDRARRTPVPLAGGTPGGLEPPVVSGPQQADLTTTSYLVRASHRHGGLQRIEFLVNDQPVDAVSFLPVPGLEVRFVVEFGRMPAGRYRLAARATGADGETVTGPEVVVESAGNSLPASKLATFRLPTVEPGVLPLTGRSTYGAEARMEAGKLVFSAHAPTTLVYPLDGRTTAVRGAFGFRPGAWAAENPGKTDGAEFIIRLVPPQGPTKVLLRQTLQPVEDPFARREQPFSLPLPAGFVGRLQFETNEGPAGNAASDWTYWSDLQLINSR